MLSRFPHPWCRVLGIAALALLVSCGRDAILPAEPGEAVHAKGGRTTPSSPVVSSVDPAYGKQGAVNLKVRIVGSGFGSDAQATWERFGIPDSKVQTNATRYISSTELEADITIAADADLDLYDVSVTLVGSGKKGVGMEMFEVTTAVSIGTLGGNSAGQAVNSHGEVVGFSGVSGGGQHAYHWSASTGMTDLGEGHAWAIDEGGLTIAGTSGGHAVVWTRTSAGWGPATQLPRAPITAGGTVRAIASDTVAGTAVLLGGHDGEKYRGGIKRRPVLWRRSAGGWERHPLSLPAGYPDAEAWVAAVNALGHASGVMVTGSGTWWAVFWDVSGTASVVGPADSRSPAINSEGTLMVGASAGRAAFWQRVRNADGTYGSWGAPIHLPGNCTLARGVDDRGRIIASNCGAGSRTTSAVFTTPVAAPLMLSGLGHRDDGGTAVAISPSGSMITGSAPTPKVTFSAIWRVFATE